MANDQQDRIDQISSSSVPTFMADLMEYVDRTKEKIEESSGSRNPTGEGVFVVDEQGRARQKEEEREIDDKVGWMRGKTVVLYGDSVQRYNLDHFCKVSTDRNLDPHNQCCSFMKELI